jgi:hypothetical protein
MHACTQCKRNLAALNDTIIMAMQYPSNTNLRVPALLVCGLIAQQQVPLCQLSETDDHELAALPYIFQLWHLNMHRLG